MRGALDQKIKDVGETKTREHCRKPDEKIAEIGKGKPPIKSHSRRVDKVQRIAPRTGADQISVWCSLLAVGNFILDPKISEQSKPGHRLGVGNAALEVEHL